VTTARSAPGNARAGGKAGSYSGTDQPETVGVTKANRRAHSSAAVSASASASAAKVIAPGNAGSAIRPRWRPGACRCTTPRGSAPSDGHDRVAGKEPTPSCTSFTSKSTAAVTSWTRKENERESSSSPASRPSGCGWSARSGSPSTAPTTERSRRGSSSTCLRGDYSAEEAQAQLDVAIDWGRCGELYLGADPPPRHRTQRSQG
jgi:hypothetical protein